MQRRHRTLHRAVWLVLPVLMAAALATALLLRTAPMPQAEVTAP